MASVVQKDTTQATVVRKLSSYARQNNTKKALWELDAYFSDRGRLFQRDRGRRFSAIVDAQGCAQARV